MEILVEVAAFGFGCLMGIALFKSAETRQKLYEFIESVFETIKELK